MQLTKQILTIDNHEIACEYVIKERNVVILHGAGESSRTRFYPFAQEILKHDYGVVVFDFMGHGESSGDLRESSLDERHKLAYKIITKLLPSNSRFILVGFSMSGETVCNLLPHFPDRIKTILLGCPGIYTNEAASLQFKDGAFTALLRTADNWKSSIAIKNLSEFDGQTFIAHGGKDDLIPKGVISMLRTTAKKMCVQRIRASFSCACRLARRTPCRFE